MPQIPVYGDRVQVNNLPSVRNQSFDTNAQAVGQGLENLSGAVAQIAARERQRADTAQLLEADTAMAELEDSLFHNPETGAYASKGKDAIGVPERIWPEWDKRQGEIRSKLPPHLQGSFGQFANNRRRDLSRSLTRHITQESDKYYAEMAEGYISTAANAAASNYTDEERIDTEVARAMIGIEGTGILEGKPEEYTKAKRMEIESRIRSGALERMLDDDPLSAQAYYDKHKDSFLGETQAKFERLMKPMVTDAKAQETAKQLLSGGDSLSALEQASKIADPTERAAVVPIIKLQMDIEAAQEREYKESMNGSIASAVESVDPFIPLSESLSREQYAYATENGLLSSMEARQRQRVSGFEPKTDPRKFNELQTLMARAMEGDEKSLKTLRGSNPVDWFSYLNTSDRDMFQERRAAILNPDQKSQAEVAEYSSENQDLEAYVWGPLGTKDMESDEVQNIQYKFNQEYLQEKGAMQESLGRKITSKERQTLMKDLMLSFVKKGGMFSSDTSYKAYELDSVIPETERLEIITNFEKVNQRTPTDSQIRVMYAMKNGYTLNADDTE